MKLLKLALIISLTNIFVFPSFANLKEQLNQQEALKKKEVNEKNLIRSKCNIDTAKYFYYSGFDSKKRNVPPKADSKGYYNYRIICVIDNKLAYFKLKQKATTLKIEEVSKVIVSGELDKTKFKEECWGSGCSSKINRIYQYSIDGKSLYYYDCLGYVKCDPKEITKKELGFEMPEYWRDHFKKHML